MVVRPEAESPASMSALFTCALGTDGRQMMPCELAAGNHEGGAPIVGLNPRAHQLEGFDDTAHRPRGERGIADEGGDQRPAGQEPCQQSHRRA